MLAGNKEGGEGLLSADNQAGALSLNCSFGILLNFKHTLYVKVILQIIQILIPNTIANMGAYMN